MMHLTGVYMIRCKTTLKIYVGSTGVSFFYRKTSHYGSLKKGKHYNKYLQYAWDKHGGEKGFEFLIVEVCPTDLCYKREQYWLDYYRSYEGEFGYNSNRNAIGMRGMKHSEETKAKMRKSSRRLKHTEETKKKISESKKGTVNSPEAIEKMRRSHTGKKTSEETKRKLSEIGKGRKHKEESCKKMSEALKSNWKNPSEKRLKGIEKATATKRDTKHRAKVSETTKNQWQNPETRDRILTAIRESQIRRKQQKK